MGEWKKLRLADLVVVNQETYSSAEEWPFINYLDTGSVTENNISDVQYLDAKVDKVPSRARRKAHPGDIVYSTVRPVQRHYAIIKEEPENFLVSTGFAVLTTIQKVADPLFIYYFLSQEQVVEELQTIAEQSVSTYPSLNPSDITNLYIEVPPLPTQCRIAAVLSAIDDKIENNRKICETLEAQAQAIFKEWFVDFGPWGGKMPAGWRMGKLGDIASYDNSRISVQDLSTRTFYSTENMLSERGGVAEASSLPPSGFVPRCIPGSVLISNIRPYFKKIHFTQELGGHSPDVLCFVPKMVGLKFFLYRLLWDDSFFAYVMSGVKGCKMPRGDKDQIMDYACVEPDKGTLERFNVVIEPICSKITECHNESHTLSEMRDALLPKLMSGEIDVDKVEI